MSNALAEYLSALDARDARERAHEVYLRAYTKLADGTAASTPAPDAAASPAALAQLRAELAATQKTRATLEAELSARTASLAALQAADAQHKTRIAQLEKHRAQLERRGRDRQDELKGKGRFVEEIQDELVALNLQLNMAEQEKERLALENQELTRRWVSKMDEEATRMNEEMGWKH